jgi:hypothetical protein
LPERRPRRRCSSAAAVALLGFVKTVETVGFGASCLAYEAMAWSIPLIERPDLLIVFVLSLVVFARAVYVPSSPLRTLVLGLMVGLPLPLGVYMRLSSIDPAQFAVVAPALGVSSVEELTPGHRRGVLVADGRAVGYRA